MDQAGWSPEPEIIEYLLSFSSDLSQRLEDGRTILESYIRNLYYITDFFSWRLDLDKLISCIEKLARRGAKWCPSEKSDYDTFRAALRKLEPYKAMSVLEHFLKIDLFGPGAFRVLISTPRMKDMLGTDVLRAAAGCKIRERRQKRIGGWQKRRYSAVS